MGSNSQGRVFQRKRAVLFVASFILPKSFAAPSTYQIGKDWNWVGLCWWC